MATPADLPSEEVLLQRTSIRNRALPRLWTRLPEASKAHIALILAEMVQRLRPSRATGDRPDAVDLDRS